MDLDIVVPTPKAHAWVHRGSGVKYPKRQLLIKNWYQELTSLKTKQKRKNARLNSLKN